MYADAGNTELEKRDALKNKAANWHVVMKRGRLKAMREGPRKDSFVQRERIKVQIRSLVE